MEVMPMYDDMDDYAKSDDEGYDDFENIEAEIDIDDDMEDYSRSDDEGWFYDD